MWRLLDDGMSRHGFNNSLEEFFTQFLVSDLTPSEHDGEAHLCTVSKEPLRLPQLCLQVVIINARSQADFLDFDDFLPLSRLSLPPAFLIPVLSVVHDSADRRDSVWLHFDKIQTALTRNPERFVCSDNAEVHTILVNQANLGYTDPFINP
jgi:hypothetical protein